MLSAAAHRARQAAFRVPLHDRAGSTPVSPARRARSACGVGERSGHALGAGHGGSAASPSCGACWAAVMSGFGLRLANNVERSIAERRCAGEQRCGSPLPLDRLGRNDLDAEPAQADIVMIDRGEQPDRGDAEIPAGSARRGRSRATARLRSASDWLSPLCGMDGHRHADRAVAQKDHHAAAFLLEALQHRLDRLARRRTRRGSD